MKRTKKQCDKCNKEISLSNFNKHYNSCKGIIKEHLKINENWKQENGLYKCPYCEKEYSKMGILSHIWRNHTEEGKFYITKPSFGNKGKPAWNRGLTKETDERIKKQGKTLTDNIKSGKTVASQTGKSIPEIQRKKISNTLIKYLQEYPDKVPYLLNHSSKMSYPEKLLYDKLTSLDIKDWIYRYRNSIYEYDFAWPELKIDVEVDGGTHNTEKVKKIDKRRDDFSKNEGWKVIRFSSEEIKHNIVNCIEIIKKEIKT